LHRARGAQQRARSRAGEAARPMTPRVR
jgi:hypothetical protein